MLLGISAGAAWSALGPLAGTCLASALKKRIQQSVCLWCYEKFLQTLNMPLDQFLAACADMGLKSIELTTPDQWPLLKKHGLICAMTPSERIAKGLARKPVRGYFSLQDHSFWIGFRTVAND